MSWGALRVIIWREWLRFWHQKERFFAALVRPLVWLFIFGAGFRSVLGLSIIPPYSTYILYETYIIPGLCAMIILFNSMQSALAMVYDREMGSMRVLLMAPLPLYSVFLSKLIASSLVSILQCYGFLAIAGAFGLITGEGGYLLPMWGYVVVMPMFLIVGLMLGAFGLVVSSFITRLQNFAGVMNFIIFPMFFLSTALYPLWRLQEGSPLLAKLASFNPFSQAVELIRFSFYLQLNLFALLWVIIIFLVLFGLALWGYDPQKSIWRRDR